MAGRRWSARWSRRWPALGLRLAEPGEFTRRAFENGKLDLAQAEAVADLVDAETERSGARRWTSSAGGCRRRRPRWREALIRGAGYARGRRGLPRRGGAGRRGRPARGRCCERLADELEAAAADVERGERVREGYRDRAGRRAQRRQVARLLNALAGRDAAIVTATPGTTRDVIEVPMVLAGYKVLLADTAGLRDTER